MSDIIPFPRRQYTHCRSNRDDVLRHGVINIMAMGIF